MEKAKTVLIWVIGIMFISTGIAKFANVDSMSAAIFSKANYPGWLFYAVAVFELAGGVLVLRSATRRAGFAMIAMVMLGAISTHLYLHDNYGHLVVPAIIAAFAIYLIVGPRSR